MRYTRKRILIICCGVPLFLLQGCISPEETTSDCYSISQLKRFSGPSFSSYIMNVRSDDKSRLDLYLQMPYSHIRFEKTIDGFRASYGITVIIKDEEHQIVQTKEAERVIEVKSYEETVSSRFDFFLQSFTLEPNSYAIEILSFDNLSKLQYRYRETIVAKNYSSPQFSASTELLLDTILTDERGITLRPVLPSSISMLKSSIGVFQEIYHTQPGDSVTVSVLYLQNRKKEDSERHDYYLVPPYKLGNIECKKYDDSIYFHSDSTFVVTNEKIVRLFQFYPLPAIGSTIVKRTLKFRNANGIDSVSSTRQLFRRDYQHFSIPTVDEILSSMRYILRDDEYDTIAVGNDEEKMKRLNAFWEKQGSYLGRSDFERRVHEANTMFSSCVDGSKTPMGIVYIICGVPDYIECRNPLTENWYYNIGERTFSIQFRQVRTDNINQYYELVPFSINETVWQYFVNKWRKR
jgi:GWxTD domain-containing protein